MSEITVSVKVSTINPPHIFIDIWMHDFVSIFDVRDVDLRGQQCDGGWLHSYSEGFKCGICRQDKCVSSDTLGETETIVRKSTPWLNVSIVLGT